MNKNARIFVAGHKGLVGSAIMRKLRVDGYLNLLYKSSKELDLTMQKDVMSFFAKERPEYVFLAAAKVGGILANNNYPADFIYRNLLIQTNVIHAAYKYNVKRLLFLGSSCIYPKFALQPLKEEYLLTGALEPTNEPYAIAKIAGIKMCEAYSRQYGMETVSVMPTNLYGTNDNFDLESAHVLPAMIRKFHEAKLSRCITLWGTGSPRREFLYVDDLAQASILLMNLDRMKLYMTSEFTNVTINIGTGEDITIKELAKLVGKIVGYNGEVLWDNTKPDGTPRKILDITKICLLGWKPEVGLEEGITKTYQWYLSNYQNKT